MMIRLTDFHPLSSFVRNAKEFVKQLRETQRPQILTVNGVPDVVILHAELFQDIMDRLEHAETVAAIQHGIRSAREGGGQSVAEAFGDLRSTLGIPEKVQ